MALAADGARRRAGRGATRSPKDETVDRRHRLADRGLREDAPAPVDVIDAEELAAQGSPTMLELTKRLPVSAGVIGDASQFDTRSQFNEGVASVNLRGLGPQRTLVLLNGKRMVATGSGNLPLVDVNLFPTAAIGRIEMLKDGAAATYGSDAIAGVVNFITRTDQHGLPRRGRLPLGRRLGRRLERGAVVGRRSRPGAAVRLGRLPAPRRADHARPRLLVPDLPREPAGRLVAAAARRATSTSTRRVERRALRCRRRLRGGRRVPLAAGLDRGLVPGAVPRLHQPGRARGPLPAVRRRRGRPVGCGRRCA